MMVFSFFSKYFVFVFVFEFLLPMQVFLAIDLLMIGIWIFVFRRTIQTLNTFCEEQVMD